MILSKIVADYIKSIEKPSHYKYITDSMIEERMMRSNLLQQTLNCSLDELRMAVKAEISNDLAKSVSLVKPYTFEEWFKQLNELGNHYCMMITKDKKYEINRILLSELSKWKYVGMSSLYPIYESIRE